MNESLNEYKNQPMYIDGIEFSPKHVEKKTVPTFKERHTKLTTYVENNLYIIIQMLKEDKQIESVTQLINDSLKYYLMEKVTESTSK